ncbi:ABC transporter permease [Mangrovicoccus sp. HB161399]|uniref:ABC transporter permease n=1 Tax=Mangrovicoccus sp. HB161399 TaxID=2720392 RepID=UPI001C130696|nr:ABC transporter permease [Mangrovicoccus sp. HB161399]
MTTDTINGKPRRLPGLKFGSMSEFGWVWIALVLVFAASAVLAPGTVRPGALLSMLPFAAMLAIVSAGQTVIIQQRGLDMSSGAIMTVSGLVVARVALETGSLPLALLATFAAAAAMGLVNGIAVSVFRITPIVATLATGAVYAGVARHVSNGNSISAPAALAEFVHLKIAGLPAILILSALVVALMAAVIRFTPLGRRFTAVGASPAAATAAGFPSMPYLVGTYAVGALYFALGGILFTGFINSATITAGNDYLLPSIAAVVVGGTPFTGGKGSVVASAVAAVFMTQLGQMVLAMGAGTPVQYLVQAAVIVLALAAPRLAKLARG